MPSLLRDSLEEPRVVIGSEVPEWQISQRGRIGQNFLNVPKQVGGGGRIRTGDRGFAGPCLTTWLRRHPTTRCRGLGFDVASKL